MTSCLTGLDSAALFMFNQQQIFLFGQIQTSQTGGQLYSDTVIDSECSLFHYSFCQGRKVYYKVMFLIDDVIRMVIGAHLIVFTSTRQDTAGSGPKF